MCRILHLALLNLVKDQFRDFILKQVIIAKRWSYSIFLLLLLYLSRGINYWT